MARRDTERDSAPSHDIHQPLLEDSVLQDTDGLTPQQGQTKLAWAVELGALLQLAAPVIIQLGSQYAVTLTNQLFVGSLGAEPLAAAAIGTTWFNLSFYFLLGISTALDTLGSQAHGKGNFGAVLACCISAAGVMGLLCLPISVALWWSDTVARVAFRQKPAIASLVKVFCAWLIPGLIPFVFAIIIMKGLQVQNMVWPPAIISTITAVVNVPVNAVLINWYGFHGAAAATSVTRIFQLVMLIAYILILYMFSQPTPPMLAGKDTAAVLVNGSLSSKAILKAGLPGHQQEEQEVADEVLEDDFPEAPQYTVMGILQGGLSGRAVWNFLLLGLPGGVMMALDAASFDITTVMAGFLGEIQVDAHTVLLTTCVFIYMSFPFGLATASTIRVGNLLGSYQPGLAKLSGTAMTGLACLLLAEGTPDAARYVAAVTGTAFMGYVATVTGTAFMGLACLLLATLRWRIGPAYVDDAEVAAQVAAVAPISAVYQIPDGIYCLASGVLRGLGKQGALAWINLISFWAVGVPTGLTLTFPLHWRLSGIWWGIVTGVTVAAVCCLVALLRIDWETEAADAHAAATADMASANSSAGSSPASPPQMPALTGDLESAMATPQSSSGRTTPIRRVPSRGSRDVPIGHPVLGSYGSSYRSSGSLVDRKLTGVFGSLQGVDPISRSFAPHH